MSTPEQMCMAKLHDGRPCPNRASHEHVTDLDVRIALCGQHLRMLKRRERGQSDEEKLAQWGIQPNPTNPGATGNPIGPEGIVG